MSLQIWMSTCWVVEICVCKCFTTPVWPPVWRQYDLHPGGSWQWGSVQGWTATHPASLLQTTWQVLLNFTLFSSKCDFLFDAGYQSVILQIFRSRTALRRVVGDAPIFGMHYSLAKPGSVSIGDKVPKLIWNFFVPRTLAEIVTTAKSPESSKTYL